MKIPKKLELNLRINKLRLKRSKVARIVPAAIAVLFIGILGTHLTHPSHAAGGPPTSGTSICGQPILDSPYEYNGASGTFTATSEPVGLPTFGSSGTNYPNATSIIVVPDGDNSVAAEEGAYQVNYAIIYFEPGQHTLSNSMYTGNNSVYIGGYTASAGKAVINGVNGATSNGLGGSGFNSSKAVSGQLVNNTYEYLTIENFTSSNNGAVMGNVNGVGWGEDGDTYEYNTIGPNEYGYAASNQAPRTGESNGGGYAIYLGNNNTVQYNCLTQNAQGGFAGNVLVNPNISHNEISANGLGEYPDVAGPGGSPYGCGCSGGGKLFYSVNAVVDYNYVHDNYNAGIWLDFDNTGADISYNYISSNWGNGIDYEASYNANISDNTLIGNGWASNGAWPAGVGGNACYNGVSCTDGLGPITGGGGGNPYSAIYLPNSGGNSSLSSITLPSSSCSSNCGVTSNYSGELLVQNNVLTNNFGGIDAYTDTNRYPGNIDNDSACSVPLGAMAQANSSTYYQQTEELTTNADTTISGSTVTTTGGTQTVCGNYGQSVSQESNSNANSITQAPSIGMAVFDMNSGDYLGNVAHVTSANTFTLNASPGNESGASLLVSAYGGCGVADYYQGGLGAKSGTPTANYWDSCIWGSRSVMVSGNLLSMQASSVNGCTAANMCGYDMLVAYNGGVPELMEFFDDYSNLIAKASGGLGNIWSNNTYTWTGGGPGSWQFEAGLQGNKVSQAQWQASPYGQDVNSTFNSVAPPSVPTNVTSTASSASSVTVNWIASSDSSGPGLGGYYILRNGTQIGTANSGTTSYTDSTVSGDTQYSYTVEAYDNANPPDVSSPSSPTVVTTPASGSNPTVNITSPANNTLVHGNSITVDSTVTPSVGNTILSAQLLMNGAGVQTLTSSPYIFTLSSVGYADGSYTLTVKATDAQGHSSTEPITITVTNGDFTGAGSVGISDLAIMAAHWGQANSSYVDGNITGQSTINISDLSVLAANWGKSW